MRLRLLFAGLIVACVVNGADAAQRSMDAMSLEVIPGVFVVVDGVTADAESDGLYADTLRADIERLLHEGGVPTLTEWEWRNTIGNPALQLTLQLVKPSPHIYLYRATLEVRQLTVLARDSSKTVFSPTWSAGTLLGTRTTPHLHTLRTDIQRLVRRFIDAYQEALQHAEFPRVRTPRAPGTGAVLFKRRGLMDHG